MFITIKMLLPPSVYYTFVEMFLQTVSISTVMVIITVRFRGSEVLLSSQDNLQLRVRSLCKEKCTFYQLGCYSLHIATYLLVLA